MKSDVSSDGLAHALFVEIIFGGLKSGKQFLDGLASYRHVHAAPICRLNFFFWRSGPDTVVP